MTVNSDIDGPLFEKPIGRHGKFLGEFSTNRFRSVIDLMKALHRIPIVAYRYQSLRTCLPLAETGCRPQPGIATFGTAEPLLRGRRDV